MLCFFKCAKYWMMDCPKYRIVSHFSDHFIFDLFQLHYLWLIELNIHCINCICPIHHLNTSLALNFSRVAVWTAIYILIIQWFLGMHTLSYYWLGLWILLLANRWMCPRQRRLIVTTRRAASTPYTRWHSTRRERTVCQLRESAAMTANNRAMVVRQSPSSIRRYLC